MCCRVLCQRGLMLWSACNLLSWQQTRHDTKGGKAHEVKRGGCETLNRYYPANMSPHTRTHTHTHTLHTSSWLWCVRRMLFLGLFYFYGFSVKPGILGGIQSPHECTLRCVCEFIVSIAYTRVCLNPILPTSDQNIKFKKNLILLKK